jgi:hypothetical protein
MESVYCSTITKSRLYQFLALLVSLDKVRKGKFRFFVLCVDDETYNVLKKMNWNNVTIIHEKELSESVRSLKQERKIHEYCWTLKPVLLETVFNQNPKVMRVTFMDSDLYFWEDPEIIFKEQENASVLLSREEKYRPEWKQSFVRKIKNITGEYNSGFISFKRDEVGMSCVQWWKEKTAEACRIDPVKGIFGDQKYLDDMSKLFTNVCDITTAGVNIGPWNYLKYTFTQKDDLIWINQNKLIFYHFSGVRVVNQENKVELIHNSPVNTPFVFTIYQNLLTQLMKLVQHIEPSFNGFATEEDLKSYW